MTLNLIKYLWLIFILGAWWHKWWLQMHAEWCSLSPKMQLLPLRKGQRFVLGKLLLKYFSVGNLSKTISDVVLHKLFKLSTKMQKEWAGCKLYLKDLFYLYIKTLLKYSIFYGAILNKLTKIYIHTNLINFLFLVHGSLIKF